MLKNVIGGKERSETQLATLPISVEAPKMSLSPLTHSYTSLEAWLHDVVIADHALNLQPHIFAQGKLSAVLAEERERSVLDVGCGGGQTVIRLKELYPHLRLTGIDLSEGQIARARRRAQRKS